MRGKPTAHVPELRLDKPKHDQDFSKPKSAIHRRRSPRICVGSQQLTFEAHPIPEPRICTEQQAYAWKASSISKFFKIHVYALKQAYAWKMYKPSLSYEDPRISVEACRSSPEDQQVPRICVESYAHAWET
ncbi:hypothetical protein PIB30_082136 [Stylosanthes scabra]|uniref:Uncharacterized protein n=1 Tax=Stylosanthes scabra TaxID=79078 RepID=A0ABU6WVB4_9FABA|nr:hypothetical protein [Stylosanthes scabra]